MLLQRGSIQIKKNYPVVWRLVF